MPAQPLPIGVVTDEISRSLPEALEIAQSWGLSRFELREGGERRFPAFSPDEVSAVEAARREGALVTAVSPGIFKGHVDDEGVIRTALEDTLPRTLDLAARFECPLVIVFGFERYDGESDQNRTRAMKAFECAADLAADAGMRVAVENEPGFWIDQPEASAAMLDEIAHPALALNWDPANLHWGGRCPTRADVDAILPHLANLHVKDYRSGHPEAPWAPVGEGETPWTDLLSWILTAASPEARALASQSPTPNPQSSPLDHVTLETHCVPLVESSRRSLAALRQLLADATLTTPS